jgi:hypothetical protein
MADPNDAIRAAADAEEKARAARLAAKKPDTDALTALGNSINDLRSALDASIKKHDSMLADLAGKLPTPAPIAPPSDPALPDAEKPCPCANCVALRELYKKIAG